MIEIIRKWCEGIIVAIIVSLIIELLIQEGNNKKYVKVVIGIYIIFVLINPLLKFFKYDFNFFDMIDVNTQETSLVIDDNIKDIYVVGIENSIKREIEELGYIVDSVKIIVDSDYEDIENVNLIIKGKKNENTIIEPVIIGENNDKNTYEDIIKLLNENYYVDENKITIK